MLDVVVVSVGSDEKLVESRCKLICVLILEM